MTLCEALLRKFLDGLRKNHTCNQNRDGACRDSNCAHRENKSQALQLQPTYSVAVLLYDVTVIPDIRPALEVLRRIHNSSSITYEYELPNHRM